MTSVKPYRRALSALSCLAILCAGCATPPAAPPSGSGAGSAAAPAAPLNPAPRSADLDRPAPAVSLAASRATGTDAPPSAAAAAPAAVAASPTAAPSAAPAASPPPAAPAAPTPPPVLPFDEALAKATADLFGKAKLQPGNDDHVAYTIDPLIDGNTRVQTHATQAMGAQVATLVKSSFPRYELQPFNGAAIMKGALLFIGTFTAINSPAKPAEPVGTRETFRICLALVDPRSGLIVSKALAFASATGVDHAPTAFFQEAPAWAPDVATQGYVGTCQGTKVGDAIKPDYWDRLLAAALINDAITAYEAGRYEEALDLYRGVLRTSAGDQLRVHNGIYLAATRLGRRDEANQAFARLVDYGIAQKRLGVKFLFRPASTVFNSDQKETAVYPGWLKQIAQRAGKGDTCIEVAGHTSRTGPEPLNERLSLLRAEYVRARLETEVPALKKMLSASGKGSRENLSGTGTDDARDALDRRVEFRVNECPKS